MPFFIDQDYEVIGAGSVVHTKRIQIDQAIWDSCDTDVQEGVENILQNQPIQLLSSSGKGNGIKQESKGVEFHTQTDKRLQYPNGTIKDETLTFSRYGKGWGH
jgi:hypothetical protein